MNQQHAGAFQTPAHTISIHRDLAYVANGHPRQQLDLYLPNKGQNLPLIIWVPGGAFREVL